MTPDQSFARWVHVSLIAFAVVFVYFLIADIWMPVTPQSRVMHPVIQVAPQVSGQVVKVHVAGNQHVRAGDLLFTLDQRTYQLAVDKARLQLEQARNLNQQLDGAIDAARAELDSARVTAADQNRELKRLQSLTAKNSVSRQQRDRAAARSQGAHAGVAAAAGRLHQLQAKRGIAGSDNLSLRDALNDLARAQLDLDYTQVRSQTNGAIANLQVTPGVTARSGQVMAAVVADGADVIADFREKSLSQMALGNPAAIVFDALPGRVFPARLSAIDAGTRAGQLAADGSLAAPESTDRWVRDAQRQRVHLTLGPANQELLQRLPSGARATVQLYPADGPAQWLGALQIRAVSLIHYIY